MRSLIVYTIVILAIFSACKKKQTSDPCQGMHPTSADFKVMEYVDPQYNPRWHNYYCDTIEFSLVQFIAEETDPGATYEWHIGAGLYTTSTKIIDFSAIRQPTSIPVELIVHKTPDSKCFPSDKGVDTSQRNIYSTPHQLLVDGKFQGYLDNNKNDTFTIGIQTSYYDARINYVGVLLTNFAQDGLSCVSDQWAGYKEVTLGLQDDGPSKWYPDGYVIIGPSQDEITATYNLTLEGTNTFTSHVFHGTRIH